MTLTSLIAKALSIYLSVDPEEVTANLTTPPRPEMGDIALPCFRYAKVMRKAPQAIADELKAALDKERETSLKALYERIERIDTAGGYLNFFIRRDYYAKSVLRETLDAQDRPGATREGEGKTVIVVDDGLATGASMRTALRALRQHDPGRLVVAVPVGPESTCRELAADAEEVVCAVMPDPFQAVGAWYQDFSQTEDEEVVDLLLKASVGPSA